MSHYPSLTICHAIFGLLLRVLVHMGSSGNLNTYLQEANRKKKQGEEKKQKNT